MLKSLKEKFLNKQFITFGFIGLLNTFLAQFFYYIFVAFTGLAPSVSSVIADILPMSVSYILNAKLTYHERLSWKAALTFPIAYLPGVIVNMLIVVFVVNILHLPKEMAKLISLPITIPLNFICVSFIMKKTSNKEVESNVEV